MRSNAEMEHRDIKKTERKNLPILQTSIIPLLHSIKYFFSLTALLMLFLVLSSCATTKLTAVWEDENFQGPIDKIVVVGAFKTEIIRNIFEDEFVYQLGIHGLDAVASYTFIPIDKVEDRDYVITHIRDTGSEAVLITRMLDKKTVRTYVPGRVHSIPDYYHRWGHYYDYIYSPGYVVNEEYAYAETNLYDTGSEKMIWSARSETKISENDEKLIRAFVETIVERLTASGLFF